MPAFIVFEGGEGCGKSTQAKALEKQFIQHDSLVVITHEPGGTPLGNKLRRWLKWGGRLTPETELLFMLAARSQLLAEIIRPALEEGFNVICDRYFYSTIAYQGYGRGMNLGLLDTLNQFVTNGLQPDLVVFLDIDPKSGLARKGSRKDRFEREDVSFHLKVREGYIKMATDDPNRWLIIDASLPKKEIKERIWNRVKPLLD